MGIDKCEGSPNAFKKMSERAEVKLTPIAELILETSFLCEGKPCFILFCITHIAKIFAMHYLEIETT